MEEFISDGQRRLEEEICQAEMCILFPVRSYSLVVADFRLPLDDGRFINAFKKEILPPRMIRGIKDKYFKVPIPARSAINQLIRLRILTWMQQRYPEFSIPMGTSVTVTRFDFNDLLRQTDTPIVRVLKKKTQFDELDQVLYRYNLLEEGESTRLRHALVVGVDDPLIRTIWHNGGKVHG